MNAVVSPGLPRWAAGLRPLLLLIGIAAAVAAGVTVVLWSRGPSYSLLYGNLGGQDQAQVAQALDAASIPYRLTADSSGIEVPADRLSQARLKLAGEGLPAGDGTYALLNKSPGFGVSDFMENARYQHALEIDLAHTIASLSPIDGARVNIAQPPQSVFLRDSAPSSASVFVQLKPGRLLSQEQVQAIVNLVASSVPGLNANEVTVVDQQGDLLSSPQDAVSAAREARFRLAQQIENNYTERIESLLTPLVGPGHVRAQVVAELDTAMSEQASEQYKPGSQIVRSEHVSQETTRGAASSAGVPGALSNEPPAAGVAQPPPAPPASGTSSSTSSSGGTSAASGSGTGGTSKTAAAAASAAASQLPESTSSQSTRNYEIDRTLAYTRQPAGRIKRLTVAVLIDNLRTIGKDGKVTAHPLSTAELNHITGLVKDAVGFDAARGDSVNVVNSSFASDGQPIDTDLQSVPIWQRPLFLELVKLAVGLIVLLVLALAVLRPLVRQLIGPARAILAAPPAPAPESALAAPAARAAVQSGAAQGAQPYEQQVSNARALVNQDAKRVAQVVRSWVETDE
jgi:flagellar M-ring protein FliF